MRDLVRVLQSGGVVLLPTDTIYGLHAIATDPRAVDRIVELKGRDDTKPFVVLAASIEQLEELGIAARPEILQALSSIWPGPLTAILSLRQPISASRNKSSLAVRIPDLAWLRDLLRETGPLISTSANRSGEPPIMQPSELALDLQRSLDAIVDHGVLNGKPSAILDVTGAEPFFVRAGEESFTQFVWKMLRKTL
ncbi:MAG TPA: L-threonylcarbamoyladenylate synthase [Thermoanaerobaculia bacterium]|nr:L-threonylcarbamoyladenylate synthase [Thermoanaerobaculia bacterium]